MDEKKYLYYNIWGSHSCVGGILSFLEYDAIKLVELTLCQFTSPHSWIFVIYVDNKETEEAKKAFPLMPVPCLDLNSTSDDWYRFRDALRCTHYTHYTRPQFQHIVSNGECEWVCVCYKQKTLAVVTRIASAPVYSKQCFQYWDYNEASLVKMYSFLLF
jgi:hypothetical protein